MTQCQAKINGPVVDTCREGAFPALIGRRASVGGSAAPADWPSILGPADSPPGGIWIGFIRRTVEHRQSIVAVTVTGSLDFPTLLSH